MAEIYDYWGNMIAAGLQGSNVCDEAIQTAKGIAKQLRQNVVLEDDDGVWLVKPNGGCEELPKNWA